MGGAISVPSSPRGNPPVANPKDSELSAKRRRPNRQIFEQTLTNVDETVEKLLKEKENVHLDEASKKLLSTAMGGFYFLQTDSGRMTEKMDMLLRCMEREEFPANHVLIVEGESGSKLYVVESGELQVTINGEVIRHMSKGSMLGELALLYDAPRTATVKCTCECVLWSLRREIFKHVQATSASLDQVERSRILISSPELAVLSAMDLSRLVGALQPIQYNIGDIAIRQDSLTAQVLLIEKGRAAIFTNLNLPSDLSRDEIDKQLCIFRSRRGTNDPSESTESLDPQPALGGRPVTVVGPGCLIGIGALRGRARIGDGWKWDGDRGAVSPLTMMALDDLQAQVFTVEAFENLFGPAEKILQVASRVTSSSGATSPANSRNPESTGGKSGDVPPGGPSTASSGKSGGSELKFDSSKFKMRCILGSGSFGVVLLGEYKVGGSVKTFALKCLGKFAVIETGQLRHVLDERRILSIMDSPLVLKLYGTYQTPHQLVMVTEALQHGDLWSVIYETSPYCDQGGLSNTLTQFYAATLILALDHIHGKGVVFRDLKPENVMIDGKGYVRVIDFGFSKKVPYTKEDSHGNVKVYAKTYTLCGTPEYLSPELIFNLGHDQSSDIWALGVLIHEMLLSVTPFAPRRPDNVTELFTNIAMVKKNGLMLTSRLDDRTQNTDCRALITQLLKPESTERVQVQGGATRTLLDHPYFTGLDLAAVEKGEYRPEHIPDVLMHYDPISQLNPVKPFHGDQKLFADF